VSEDDAVQHGGQGGGRARFFGVQSEWGARLLGVQNGQGMTMLATSARNHSGKAWESSGWHQAIDQCVLPTPACRGLGTHDSQNILPQGQGHVEVHQPHVRHDTQPLRGLECERGVGHAVPNRVGEQGKGDEHCQETDGVGEVTSLHAQRRHEQKAATQKQQQQPLTGKTACSPPMLVRSLKRLNSSRSFTWSRRCCTRTFTLPRNSRTNREPVSGCTVLTTLSWKPTEYAQNTASTWRADQRN
jgi:hypothetical protein